MEVYVMIYNNYIELKKNNDKLLYLFEVGNFFIFIDEDARKVSNIINLKLTSFGNNVKCVFPINSLDKYINLFNELGLNVSVIYKVNNKEVVKNKDIEELDIYKKYIDLIYYTEMITRKYTKYEKFCLVNDIKSRTYNGLELIIRCYKSYKKEEKIRCLNELDVLIRCIQVFVRVSYKNKYITNNNYFAWSNKLFNIGNLLGGWINSCVKL